jgi:hypothetical protein
MKQIYIGGINRSGGSLLARLFDGHPDVASYPLETSFPINKIFYPFVEALSGSTAFIPSYKKELNENIFDILNIKQTKEETRHVWGEEKGDSAGVRKNYLEKEFYGSVKTDFDYKKYVSEIEKKSINADNLNDLYNIKHKAYFDAWDEGKHSGNLEYVITHDSNGLFISNTDKFFKEFPESFFIHPIRNVTGYVASEKTRITRRYYGSRRFPKIKMPNIFVKRFRSYDIEALIRCWLVSLTRAVLLQEEYGVHGRFLVYRYENLVNDTDKSMKSISSSIGLNFNDSLLEPTIMGNPWGGNSHQGKQSGVNKELKNYYSEVLTKDELELISERCGAILEYLDNTVSTPCDLTKIPKKMLYDYEFQKKYFNDEEKIALYTALAFSGMRKAMVSTPNFSAVVAYFYSKIVRIAHIPRLIKLNLFPGLGKQNYT